MPSHKGRHSSRTAAKPRKRNKAPTSVKHAPSALSGHGHAAPSPAQFGARQAPGRPAVAPVSQPALALSLPDPSTAEPEPVVTGACAKAHSAPMTQHKPPHADPPSAAPGTVTARQLPFPAFPPPQLPAILAQQPIVPPATPQNRVITKPSPSRVVTPPLPAPPPHDVEPRALPLPHREEPLTQSASQQPVGARPIPPLVQRPASGRQAASTVERLLPRDRALAKPGTGLLGAVNTWLRSTGQRLLSGFMVKKKRQRPMPPVSMRERVELTQLRAENRRLRRQIDSMDGARAHDDVLSRADRAETEQEKVSG